MNIDFNLYYIFYVTAKNQNITKAAEELYVSQPSVTQAIKSLEKQIGATLFIRTKKGVKLTEEASILYEFIKEGITYIKNGENKFQELMNLQEGTLKIGASTTVTENVLVPYLQKFKELYPKISISIINHLTTDLIKLLRNGSVDLLILNLPTKETNDLKIIPFYEVHDTFMVGKKYQHLIKNKWDIKDLASSDFIFQRNPSNTRQFLDQWLKKENILINPKLEVVSFHLVKNLTKVGMGIGYLTKEFVMTEIENKELFVLPTTQKIPSRKIGIVTLKNNIPSFAARQFLNLINKNTKINH